MGDIINTIRETFHAIGDKYYVQVFYLDTKGKTIPELLDKKYVIYDSKTFETDFTDDPKKATCFDFALGALISKNINKSLQGDPNIKASLISVGDARFIADVTGGLKNIMDETLAPEEKAQMKLIQEALKVVSDLIIPRIEGVHGLGPVVDVKNGKKIPTLEISVNDIDTKTRLYAFKVGEAQDLLLTQDKDGNTFYKSIPVRIVIQEPVKVQGK